MRALHAIVLAGGSGRRLAALTERITGRPTPKQYCALGGSQSLIQETLARIAPLIPPHRTAVVTHDAHDDLAREQLRPFPGVTILSQPADCGTGAGVLRGIAHVLAHDPRACVVVTPADHGVRDRDSYLRGIAAAGDACDLASATLLGVAADEPRSDYGWILPGAEIAPGVRRVAGFVEKPDPARAEALVVQDALYSTMVLVAQGRSLVRLIERVRPGLTAAFAPLAVLPPPADALHLRRAYSLLPRCDFSRDILAGANDLAVVRWPDQVGWTDLGTPERVAEWLASEPSPLPLTVPETVA